MTLAVEPARLRFSPRSLQAIIEMTTARTKPCFVDTIGGIRALISLILMMEVMTWAIRRASIDMRMCKTIRQILSTQLVQGV
jgi:hypothetical protein